VCPTLTWLSGVGAAPDIAAFGAWRGRPAQMAATWDDTNDAMVNSWAFQPGGELELWTNPVSIAVGGFAAGETWAQAAAGNFDSRWTTCLTNMRDLRAGKAGTIYIRPFHEMNGNWMAWSVYSGDEANFVTAWRRFRALQQSIYPASKLNFCPNNGSSQLDWRTYWPGNAYVDVVGVDYYNHYPTITDDATWTAALTLTTIGGAPQGLQTWLDYAASVGKPLVIDEWAGVADAGDNPAFIQHMHDFFSTNGGTGSGKLLYESYFDSNETTYNDNFDLYPATQQPNTAARYRQLWSADMTVDVGNTLTYTVTGLSPSTAYTVIVRAYDSGGVRGADSLPLGVTTAAASATPITLADTGSGTDAITHTINTIPKTLADTAAGTDALSYTLTGGPTSKSLADTSSATVDFLSFTGSRGLTVADTGSGTDAISRTVTGGPPTQVPLADVAFPAVDALTHTGGTVTPPAPAPDFEKLEWVDPDGVAIPLTQRISGKGRWMPPIKIVRDQYAGLLGTRARQVTLDTASVLVPVLVTTATADDYRNLVRAMASSLNPMRGPGKLRATLTHTDASVTVREMVAYYTAGMDFPEDQLDVGYPSLLFNSEGPPYWTDAADTTVTYSNNATAYTWFPFGGSPWTPLILNQSTIFAQDTVINDGDAPVYPIWSLTGPVDGVIQLDNLTTGKSLWFDYTITSGQTAVVIDTRPGTKSITQGPVSLYRYLTAWDMWPFEPGRNDIVLTVPGATAATQMSRTYRRGFLAA
jgi:hypothetical protein